MFKLMNKQRNKKGFTLIELIVVIAILGILALIAIPRFAGFTDRAKIGNDEQYAAIVGNSLVVMLASDDFTLNDSPAEFEIDADGTVSVQTAADVTGFVVGDLEKLVNPVDLQYYDGGMVIQITSTGEHELVSGTSDATGSTVTTTY